MSENIAPVQQQSSDEGTSCDKDSTFTVFPSLPAELRTKIWEFALPNPAIIEIQLEETSSHTIWTTLTPVSPFMHIVLVNCEAYNVTKSSGHKATPIWIALRDNTKTTIFSRLWIIDKNTTVYLPSKVYSQLNYIRHSRCQKQTDPALGRHHLSKLTVEFNGSQARENIHWLSEFITYHSRDEMTRYLAGLCFRTVLGLKEIDLVIDCRDYRFSDATETIPISKIAFEESGAEHGRQKILDILNELTPKVRVFYGSFALPVELSTIIKPSILVNGSTREERERCMRFFRRSCRFVDYSPNLPLRQACTWTRCEFEREQEAWDDDFELGDHAPIQEVRRRYGCLHVPASYR